MADSPVGQYDDHRNTSYFEGYLVACGFENIALRDRRCGAAFGSLAHMAWIIRPALISAV
jgi:hypothetical protein